MRSRRRPSTRSSAVRSSSAWAKGMRPRATAGRPPQPAQILPPLARRAPRMPMAATKAPDATLAPATGNDAAGPQPPKPATTSAKPSRAAPLHAACRGRAERRGKEGSWPRGPRHEGGGSMGRFGTCYLERGQLHPLARFAGLARLQTGTWQTLHTLMVRPRGSVAWAQRSTVRPGPTPSVSGRAKPRSVGYP